VKQLSHLSPEGKAQMVDVSAKAPTPREATARALVRLSAKTLKLIREGALPKGDVQAVARLAGIMAAKKTAELIPLCHPIGLSSVQVQLKLRRQGVEVLCTARTVAPTGVEMEALVGASVAALSIYDMCKAVEREASIEGLMLLQKKGGKSGHWRRSGP
jgi:cyclic pyranopterin phosphate synthase